VSIDLDQFGRQLLNLRGRFYYDALMSRMMRDNPNVRRFTTNVALGVVKRGLTVPVPIEP
jgi:hypothetical protein